MSRQARIDAPGALHHIVVRGIDKTGIFADDRDKSRFLERLGKPSPTQSVRAQLVKTIVELDRYPWIGHSTIVGRSKHHSEFIMLVP